MLKCKTIVSKFHSGSDQSPKVQRANIVISKITNLASSRPTYLNKLLFLSRVKHQTNEYENEQYN